MEKKQIKHKRADLETRYEIHFYESSCAAHSYYANKRTARRMARVYSRYSPDRKRYRIFDSITRNYVYEKF